MNAKSTKIPTGPILFGVFLALSFQLLIAGSRSLERKSNTDRADSEIFTTYRRYEKKVWDGHTHDHKRWEVVSFHSNSMKNIDFSWSQWLGVEVQNSNLSRSSFFQSKIVGSQISNSNLVHSNFQKAKLMNVWIIDSNLENSDFRSADISSTLFVHSNLKGAIFNDLTRLPFTKAYALAKGMKHVP